MTLDLQATEDLLSIPNNRTRNVEKLTDHESTLNDREIKDDSNSESLQWFKFVRIFRLCFEHKKSSHKSIMTKLKHVFFFLF